MSTLVTQAALARELGISRQYINKLVRTGILQLVDGRLLDLEACLKRIKKTAEGTKENVADKYEKMREEQGEYKPKEKAKATYQKKPKRKYKDEDKNIPKASPLELKRSSQANQEYYKALILKHKYNILIERYIDSTLFEAALMKILKSRDMTIKKSLMAVPTRIASEWDDPKSRQEIKAKLEEHIKEVLIELSSIKMNDLKMEAKENELQTDI